MITYRQVRNLSKHHYSLLEEKTTWEQHLPLVLLNLVWLDLLVSSRINPLQKVRYLPVGSYPWKAQVWCQRASVRYYRRGLPQAQALTLNARSVEWLYPTRL